jgi:hypothetical protein
MREADQATASQTLLLAQQARDTAACELLASQDKAKELAAEITELQRCLVIEADARQAADARAAKEAECGVEVCTYALGSERQKTLSRVAARFFKVTIDILANSSFPTAKVIWPQVLQNLGNLGSKGRINGMSSCIVKMQPQTHTQTHILAVHPFTFCCFCSCKRCWTANREKPRQSQPSQQRSRAASRASHGGQTFSLPI